MYIILSTHISHGHILPDSSSTGFSEIKIIIWLCHFIWLFQETDCCPLLFLFEVVLYFHIWIKLPINYRIWHDTNSPPPPPPPANKHELYNVRKIIVVNHKHKKPIMIYIVLCKQFSHNHLLPNCSSVGSSETKRLPFLYKKKAISSIYWLGQNYIFVYQYIYQSIIISAIAQLISPKHWLKFFKYGW